MENVEGEWYEELFYKLTWYEKSRTNTDLDTHSKDRRKVIWFQRNQKVQRDNQHDKKGSRASLTVVKTGSIPTTLTALAENDDNTNDNKDRAYSQERYSWNKS